MRILREGRRIRRRFGRRIAMVSHAVERSFRTCQDFSATKPTSSVLLLPFAAPTQKKKERTKGGGFFFVVLAFSRICVLFPVLVGVYLGGYFAKDSTYDTAGQNTKVIEAAMPMLAMLELRRTACVIV